MINGSFNLRPAGGYRQLIWGTAVARLITVNCAVFVLVTVANLICGSLGFGDAAATRRLALPDDASLFVTRPWSLFTYMVVNTDVLRLLFNMLWLLCFGRLLSLPLSPGRLIGLYITGGACGGALYLGGALCNLWQGGWLIGPSASILALTVATAIMLPKLEINMLIVGRVQVVWVALCVILIYFLDIDGRNLGGNAAHVGGALTGAVYALCRGRVPGLRLKFLEELGKRHKQSKTARNTADAKASKGEFTEDDHRQLDAILDKVKRAGYGALSDDEKRRLFDISGRIK